MTPAAIFLLIQILATVCEGEWALVKIIEAVKRDGGIVNLYQDLLELVRGQLTPPTLVQLQSQNPVLHAKACELLSIT